MTESVYVLGMTKSSLQFKTSGPRRNLELDVLRLIYFINLYKGKGVKMFGVILIHNDEIKNLVNEWIIKYAFENKLCFEILKFDNEIEYLSQKDEIYFEKLNNKTFNSSIAKKSKLATEKILERKIIERFGFENLIEVEKDDKLNTINWDFIRLLKQ